MDRLLKLPEVAQRLGVSEKTARRYVKAGSIPSIFVGGAYRVSEEDVAKYLSQARVGGEEPEAPKAQAPLPFEGEGGQRRNPFLEAWKSYMHRRAKTWEKTLEEEGDEIFKDPFDAFEWSEWIQQEAEALIMALGADPWGDMEAAFAHERAKWEFAEVLVAIGAVVRAAQKWRYRALSTWSTTEEETVRQKLERAREKALELDTLVALFPMRDTA